MKSMSVANVMRGREGIMCRRYVQAELVHCRYAMTAVAGILIPGVSLMSTQSDGGGGVNSGLVQYPYGGPFSTHLCQG